MNDNDKNAQSSSGVAEELIAILREEVVRLQIQNMDLRAILSYKEKQEPSNSSGKDI